MCKLFTLRLASKNLCLSLLLLLPLLGRAQTTIVNYDFNTAANTGATYNTLTPTTASGVSSTLTSSEAFGSATGTATGSGAFASNATGPALGMASNSTATGRYFQVALAGGVLPKYSAYKVYFQGYRSSAGSITLTLQYSLDGTSYTSFGPVFTPGAGTFSEASYDLSGVPALSALSSLSFRLLTSANTSGTLRVDNFQVQAVNTVDPSLTTVTPSTVAAGGPNQVITLSGSNFASGSVVSFNGQNLPTTYNSATSLTATVPVALLATPGSFPVVVTSPGAGGSTSSAAVNFVVTAAVPRWVGGSTGSWFEPTNWSTGAVPATTDDVLLDHSFVAASYTVSLDQNTAVSVQSLTVNPGVGDSIFVVVPAVNTLSNALTLSNTAAGSVALAIYNKGVVTNASGASSGASVDVAGTGPTAFIYNGGSYRQASGTTHRLVVENLSTVASTEQGIFDFRLPATGTRSYTPSVANRTYGTLIMRSPSQTATSYAAGAANSLVIRGNLLVGPGATFTPTVGGDLQVAGDIRVQGSMPISGSTSTTTPSNQLVLNGTKRQTISGNISFVTGGPAVGLTVSNPAGVSLATSIAPTGSLTLTSGILSIVGNNLLTLGPTVSVVVGSTSFINGPLARQTAAGSLTNLLFPLGSSTGYHPVTLNATAQDATTYLVTETEGPAPDYGNLPASTSALPQLRRVSRARFYTITPTPAANNFSGNVTLPLDPTDLVNAPNDASLVIGKNSGSGWQNIGNSAVAVTTPAPTDGYASGTITSGTFTSFSSFALASTSADPTINPLPVTLTSFGAQRQATAVRLSWTTAIEQNNARFDVQRSLDGQLFATVATVAGRGTATQPHQYVALDPAAPVGALYYRLAQVDTDGRTTFSPVVALTATSVVALYPNPTRDWLSVPAAPGTIVRILDLTGHVLHTLALPPSGELNVASLPAGTYLLRLEDGTSTLRFTKE